MLFIVHWTREHGLPLSVRGAGHEIFGRSLRENGIVIDLSQMKAITVARTAQVQSGATAGELISSRTIRVSDDYRNRLPALA